LRGALRHETLVLSILAAVTFAGRAAWAHDVGVSRGDYVVAGGVVEARLVFAERDRALLVTPGDLIFVDADDSPCRKTDEQVTPRAQEDAVEVDLRFVCPAGAEAIVLQAGFLAQDGTHRHLAHVTVPGAGTAGAAPRELDVVLAAGHERVQIATGADDTDDASSGVAGFLALLRTGALHVLGGPDHLAFLLALALESVSFLELVQVATAFTLAHSLTLALATAGIARPPSSWIEPLVALSIAAVALRSVLATRRGAPARSRSGWPLAFLFGLVHGFAFAGALRTLGLHGLPLARSVVGFNLGVEAGQLVALVMLVSLLAGLARLVGDRRRVVRGVGTVLTALGVFWFVARIVASVLGWKAW
jgi:hypothetical protein